MTKWWMWCDIGSCPNFAKQSIIDSKKKAHDLGMDVCPICGCRKKMEKITPLELAQLEKEGKI